MYGIDAYLDVNRPVPWMVRGPIVLPKGHVRLPCGTCFDDEGYLLQHVKGVASEDHPPPPTKTSGVGSPSCHHCLRSTTSTNLNPAAEILHLEAAKAEACPRRVATGAAGVSEDEAAGSAPA